MSLRWKPVVMMSYNTGEFAARMMQTNLRKGSALYLMDSEICEFFSGVVDEFPYLCW